jgi:hypothetical protein
MLANQARKQLAFSTGKLYIGTPQTKQTKGLIKHY